MDISSSRHNSKCNGVLAHEEDSRLDKAPSIVTKHIFMVSAHKTLGRLQPLPYTGTKVCESLGESIQIPVTAVEVGRRFEDFYGIMSVAAEGSLFMLVSWSSTVNRSFLENLTPVPKQHQTKV
eukprot:scaffold198295_cov20-Tisochrysis_lutea.AAC.2